MKVYEAKIKKTDDGVFAFALVDHPANELPVFLFSEIKEKMFFSSDEKRIVTGVLLEPDVVIPRRGMDGELVGIVFRKNDIEEMALKFSKENRHGFVNLDHNGIKLDGIIQFENWIVGEQDKIHSLMPNVKAGSWATSIYVENQEVWDVLKEGKFNGFSIEANISAFEVNFEKEQEKEEKKEEDPEQNFIDGLKDLINKFDTFINNATK